MKFFTQEALDEFKKLMETDPEVKKTIKDKKMSMSTILVATDCPGKEDREMRVILKDGKLIEAKIEAKPAPSDFRTKPLDKRRYNIKLVDRYEAMARLMSGKTSLAMGGTRQMKIQGDMMKMMSQTESFMSFLDVMRKIPLEY